MKATIALEDQTLPHRMRAAVDTDGGRIAAIPAVCSAPGFMPFQAPCNYSAGAGRLTTSRYAS